MNDLTKEEKRRIANLWDETVKKSFIYSVRREVIRSKIISETKAVCLLACGHVAVYMLKEAGEGGVISLSEIPARVPCLTCGG